MIARRSNALDLSSAVDPSMFRFGFVSVPPEVYSTFKMRRDTGRGLREPLAKELAPRLDEHLQHVATFGPRHLREVGLDTRRPRDLSGD